MAFLPLPKLAYFYSSSLVNGTSEPEFIKFVMLYLPSVFPTIEGLVYSFFGLDFWCGYSYFYNLTQFPIYNIFWNNNYNK